MLKNKRYLLANARAACKPENRRRCFIIETIYGIEGNSNRSKMKSYSKLPQIIYSDWVTL